MQRRELLTSYAGRVIGGERLVHAEAAEILAVPHEEAFHLLASANDVRRHFKGDSVDLCVIVNAKSGACSEDCAYCAQSAHHDTDAPVYPLMSQTKILEHARAAESVGANKFSLVTSGNSIQSEEDIEHIRAALEAVARETALDRCGSLGSVSRDRLKTLKAAGLQGLHHNIETAESFFDEICSTHTYADRIRTVRLAQESGFYVCSGGIFGMGESTEQRIEMALALRELNVDSVPLNFLNPIPGTRLENAEPMHPLDILKTIALFRFILPDKDIRICGGREHNLRSLQPLMYAAGANGAMVGNYLTTRGRDSNEDIQMIEDLGLRAAGGGTLTIHHDTGTTKPFSAKT